MKLFKVSDGGLAVLASVPGPFPGPPKIFQDGNFDARSQVSVMLRDASGRSDVFAILNVPERSVTIDMRTRDGASLVDPFRVEDAQISELQLPEVLGTADCDETRVKFLRFLIQGCASLPHLSGSPEFAVIRASAIQQLRAYAIQLPALSRLSLPPRFSLWTFAEEGLGEIQATQVLDPNRGTIRSSPFKPVVAFGLDLPGPASGARDILVETDGTDSEPLELLLWAADSRVYLVEARDASTLAASDLVSLLRERRDSGLDLIAYLASVLAPYLESHPKYAQLMREVRVQTNPAR